MNDNPLNNGDQPPPPPVTPTAVLQIFLLPDGSVEVSGPVDNQLFAYGMLLMGHDRLKDYHDQKSKAGIISVPPGTKLKT